MKPRIFVSSTFYDLKYVREEISSFIKNYNFEPVMFEDGDIGYTPGENLDTSCYDALKTSDMVILIVGGKYGSASTQNSEENFDSFISITKQEYRTAINNRVPVFAFVDSKVLNEYHVYLANIDKIYENKKVINFSVTKDINVFKFIDEIYNFKKIPVNSFDKIRDIKDFMILQWSDMFKKHLMNLKEEANSEKINTTMNDIDMMITQMRIMVNKIGEITIKNKSEYMSIINEQSEIEVIRLAKSLANAITIKISRDDKKKKSRKIIVRNVLETLNESYHNYLNNDINVPSNNGYSHSLTTIFGINFSKKIKTDEIIVREYEFESEKTFRIINDPDRCKIFTKELLRPENYNLLII